MRKILTKLFGDPNEAPLKPYQKVVAQVNALEPRWRPFPIWSCAS